MTPFVVTIKDALKTHTGVWLMLSKMNAKIGFAEAC
jgi:hypothetical protein